MLGQRMISALVLLAICGCSRSATPAAPQAGPAATSSPAIDPPLGYNAGVYRGFDRNDYPGDDAMITLHNTFAFTGYWLTNPPGESSNTWLGKREFLRRHGWGFLVLSNGRLDDEILKSLKHGTTPADLARADAAVAITAARSEGFPPHTILFLDQEEGGRLLDEQSAYLLAWTEAVAASDYRPGVYASGQPVPDGPPLKGKAHTITTIDDIREQVKAKHLHEIAFFDAQDACPPAPGCTLATKPLAASGELDLTAWQYAQSPRRPEITRSCKATYAAPNGNADNCYAPGSPTLFLDMDAATSADPSHGR